MVSGFFCISHRAPPHGARKNTIVSANDVVPGGDAGLLEVRSACT
jgi:hypothetical protein